MGSLQQITENVVSHVPKNQRDNAVSALQAMTDLCRWVDGGTMVLNPHSNTTALVTSCRSFLGTHPELYVSQTLGYPGELPFPVEIVYDQAMAAERLNRAFPRQNVRNDVAEAIPWSINAAIWQHLPGRLAASVRSTAKDATAKDMAAIIAMTKEITHTYILAVLGGNESAIATLRPIVRAMPHLFLVGAAPMAGHKEPMAAFIRLF